MMAHVIRTLSGKTTWKEDLWAPMIQPIACCAMATRQLKCGWLVGLNAGMLAGLFACPQRPALYVLLLNDMPHILSDCQLRHTNCWNSGTCNTSNQPPVSHKLCLKHGLDPSNVQGFGGFLFEGDEKHRPALEAIIWNRKEAGPEIGAGHWRVVVTTQEGKCGLLGGIV